MPIFIGGMFKSGTSLARKFLGNNPKIFSGLETNWFEFDNHFIKKQTNSESKIDIWSSFFKIDKSKLKNIISSSKSSEEVLNNLMEIIIKKKGLKEWCDKSPPNIIYGQRILSYWENAKIIHIKRDPLDVYASCKEAKKWDNPKLFVDTWSKIFESLNPLRKSRSFHEIHYEDIILNRVTTLKEFYGFCELNWDDKYSNHVEDKNEYLLVKEKTGKESTTLKRLSEPITKDRIGIGKKTLPEWEINKIISYIKEKELLKEFKSASWN